MKKTDDGLKVRYESFGGIIGINDPPALVYVNKTVMKELGYQGSEIWKSKQEYLSAPTEVHFNVTNSCPLSCKYCTSDSSPGLVDEMSLGDIKKAIDVLAGMKVFHIAFGGGELFSRADAIDIAQYARTKGIVPNATTNGYYITAEIAAKCRIFGQINVSIDGIGDNYGIVRGVNIFDRVDNAVKFLVEAGVKTGINCVVTRANYERLEEVVAYAQERKLNEVLFLRLKPSGRAMDIYNEYKLTSLQSKNFYKLLKKMSKKYQPNILIDCSFIPHICYHKPSKRIMSRFGVEGCEGGNVLLGVRHDGWINACSHYNEYLDNLFRLPVLWEEDVHFKRFRERNVSDRKCRECTYFKICRGGCPIFSEFLTGDFNSPDPECPGLSD